MKEFPTTSKVYEKQMSFFDIELGQMFVMIAPPVTLKTMKGKVFFKLAKNRIQLVEDHQIRFSTDTHRGGLGPVYKVFIYPGEVF